MNNIDGLSQEDEYDCLNTKLMNVWNNAVNEENAFYDVIVTKVNKNQRMIDFNNCNLEYKNSMSSYC